MARPVHVLDMGGLRALLTRLLHRVRRPRARVVRRVALICPHRCELVEVHFDQSADAGSHPVLRCSARDECPPTCDHACRNLPAAFHGPAQALLIFPPDTDGVPDDVD